MSFENTCVFPFPAVQYIPLPLNNLKSGTVPTGQKRTEPLLLVGPAIQQYAQIHQLDLPDSLPGKCCPILAIHLNVATARYRSFFVTMLGERTPGSFQLFSLPADRFYKEKLFFEVFEEKSGLRLARYSFFAPQGTTL